MSRRVLVVDDEKLIVKGIRFSLEQDGYDVDCAYDGEEALKLAKENAYDIILLDVMLPKYDGFEVCQQIREYSDVPIIMLTAKGDDMDKILGLDYGADDYITKPFNILEVKARIKAIMRRVSKRDKNQENEKVIVKGEMKIDCESRRVIIGEKEINLTAKEFDLLELLAMNPGKVYSRENLLNIVWGYEYPGDARTVDVHIRRLREKIETNPSDPKYVYTNILYRSCSSRSGRRIVHLNRTSCFFIHPVQICICIWYFWFDLEQICSCCLCHLLCYTFCCSACTKICY